MDACGASPTFDPIRRLTARAIRPHLPRRTVRLRLTAVYGGLFLASGTGLLAITYVLVVHATDGVIFKGENFNAVIGAHQGLTAGSRPPAATDGHGLNGAPTLLPEQAAKLAKHQHAAELHQLLLSSGIALAIMAVVSIALGWFIAGRVLRPLRAITASVRDISANNLHERLTLRGPDDELRELGGTFNGLLARLDASFSAQRRFIANASHELRTPLARQRALAQVALADPDANADTLRVAHERVLVAGVQQERLIDALLVLARGQAGLSASAPVDLSRTAERVIADRRVEAMSLGVTVRATLIPAPTTGDARLIERLVANLVDNALRHNVDDGDVEVATRVQNDEVVLAVSNTGPFVPAAEVARLFQPFQRLGADRVGRGAGLGLSIVQAISDAHGATLHTRPRPTGGLYIEIAFARASDGVEDAGADRRPPWRAAAIDASRTLAVGRMGTAG
jgi:signal transduction histidine kinase